MHKKLSEQAVRDCTDKHVEEWNPSWTAALLSRKLTRRGDEEEEEEEDFTL